MPKLTTLVSILRIIKSSLPLLDRSNTYRSIPLPPLASTEHNSMSTGPKSLEIGTAKRSIHRATKPRKNNIDFRPNEGDTPGFLDAQNTSATAKHGQTRGKRARSRSRASLNLPHSADQQLRRHRISSNQPRNSSGAETSTDQHLNRRTCDVPSCHSAPSCDVPRDDPRPKSKRTRTSKIIRI